MAKRRGKSVVMEPEESERLQSRTSTAVAADMTSGVCEDMALVRLIILRNKSKSVTCHMTSNQLPSSSLPRKKIVLITSE